MPDSAYSNVYGRIVNLFRLACARAAGMPSWVRWPVIAALALAAAATLDVAVYAVYPDVSALATNNPGKTAMMLERERERADGHTDRKVEQEWVRLDRISPALVSAVLIAEDDKFWSHEGFDFEGIRKAMEKNIERRRLSAGGSTITQQLAKNLYLSPSRSPVRKLKEAILAWRLERALTKRRILEIYLNVAEWGDGIFGIEAASRHYYGRPASSLGPHEAARLAAVLPNPRRYSPTGTSRYVEGRARVIYEVMLKRGVVPQDVAELINGIEDAPAALENFTVTMPETGIEYIKGTAPEPGMENVTGVAPGG